MKLFATIAQAYMDWRQLQAERILRDHGYVPHAQPDVATDTGASTDARATETRFKLAA